MPQNHGLRSIREGWLRISGDTTPELAIAPGARQLQPGWPCPGYLRPNLREWIANHDFVASRLKTEIYNLTFAVDKGDEVEAQFDPPIRKGAGSCTYELKENTNDYCRAVLADEKNPWLAAEIRFDLAAENLKLDDGTRKVLKSPAREITVNIPVEMDDGRLEVFHGVSGAALDARPGQGAGPVCAPMCRWMRCARWRSWMTWKCAV